MKSKLLSKNNSKYTEPKSVEQVKHLKELVSNAISNEKKLRDLEREAKQNKYLKGFYAGQYNGNLLYYIKGLKVLKMAVTGGLSVYSAYLNNDTKSDTDTRELKRNVVRLGKNVIEKALDSVVDKLEDNYKLTREEYMFEQICEFINNGRNLITDEKEIDGVVTQRPVSPEVMYCALEKYTDMIEAYNSSYFDICTDIGMEAISFFGSITELARESRTKALAYGALNIAKNIIDVSNTLESEREAEEFSKKSRVKWDEIEIKQNAFLRMPPLNKQSVEKEKADVIKARREGMLIDKEININRKRKHLKGDVIYSAIIGSTIISEVRKNKGLGVSDLSKIVIRTINNGAILKVGEKSINRINVSNWKRQRYIGDLEYVLGMARQIESKNDELVSPEVNVRTVEFKDFRGEFYKTKIDGKDVPECVINIPQMELESGKTVLLTGDSGCGKSTILRFLRDGDLGNRRQIIVNGNEAVDKLGTDIVTFCEAKMNLHSQNIVEAITGKRKWSEVSKKEKENLKEIFYDLGFLNSDREQNREFIRKCEYKDYDQFSTGQQKRLELAKALFEINDNSQVVLLDETVSNIQKDLGESAFRLIDKYTKKGKPKIVVMVSHDIESASKFADKRYHINKDRTMVEVPLRGKETAEGPEI